MARLRHWCILREQGSQFTFNINNLQFQANHVRRRGFDGQRGLQSKIYKYTRVPNGMNIEHLSEEELKDSILQKQLQWIKLCQDNFIIFAETVWQDFIYRKTKDPKKWGHHQIIANE